LADTWAKVASKINLKRSKRKILKIFHPVQLGMDTKNGIEIIVHSLKRVEMDQFCSDFDEVSIDFTNAFNRASRRLALQKMHDLFPEIYPYAYMMYASSSRLLLRDDQKHHIVISKEGARQGDALGTLMFCLTEQDFLDEINDIMKGLSTYNDIEDRVEQVSEDPLFKQAITLGYVDNITIRGPSVKCKEVLRYIIKRGPAIGLFLNAGKTSVRLRRTLSG
jgi:hypothetical protein